jgi:hypothetical protein
MQPWTPLFNFAPKRRSASNQNQGPPLPEHLILDTAQTLPTRWGVHLYEEIMSFLFDFYGF